MGWRMAERYAYVGLEPDPASCAIAEGRLAVLGRGRMVGSTAAAFRPNEAFDIVCAFEVLEHQSDDAGELVRWRSFLRPGGNLLLSVPAHRERFGPSDEAVGHFRRYDRSDLERVLGTSGFEPVWIESWGAGLGHLLDWARDRISAGEAERGDRRSAADATARSGRWLQPRGPIVGWLAAVLAAPFRILQIPMRGSDFGIGWVALARRIE